jgi:hypothetical protein
MMECSPLSSRDSDGCLSHRLAPSAPRSLAGRGVPKCKPLADRGCGAWIRRGCGGGRCRAVWAGGGGAPASTGR